ncbi:MAG: STAS domain-containing protein [Prevotella sp.]|nr:STAS domain-containing protein [Prevotella sp.]
MTLSITKQEDLVTITLAGELNTAESRQAEMDLAPVFYYDNCDFYVDCKDLTYIASSGLRLLLSLYKYTHKTGHQITIAHPNDDIKEVFTISGFMQLFKIEE